MDNHINTHTNFSYVGLLGRIDKSSVLSTLSQLVVLLLDNHYHVVIGDEMVEVLSPTLATPYLNHLMVVDTHTMADKCDVVIVVGGDGSMLQAGQLMAGSDTPILGVNRGRLGFLADIHPDELSDKVLAVLGGAYELDRRFLLSMQIWQEDKLLHQDIALNDVVLHAGKSVHTIDFQLKIDGVDVYRQHADGLIVATPTGSTAYSLSAGGPIIHPSLSAICLSPMYPHTLSSRPILVADTSHIELKVHKDNRTQPMVSADGKPSVPLNAGQLLTITKYPHELTLLHPVGFDFYQACRTKLNWSLYSDEFSLLQSEFE